MSEEEKSLFAFLKEYKDEPNVPDYTGEYPPPYELTQDDAELILNVKEKQDKEIERLKDLVKQLWNNNKSSNLNEEQKELLNSTIFGSDKE